MDAGCTLIAGLCATEQSLGYLLVDTQSQFQVRFDPLCPHWEELNLREEKKKKKVAQLLFELEKQSHKFFKQFSSFPM